MTYVVRNFITHKLAENAEDCQDSLCVDAAKRVFAVADGAGGSFFPREWAQSLTERFGSDPERALAPATFSHWLRTAHDDWYAAVKEVATTTDVNFLVKNGFHARHAAAAAFVGISLGKLIDGQIGWRAMALGDSCLCHARADALVNTYPFTKSTEFSFELRGLSSYPEKNPVVPTFFDSQQTGSHAAIVEGDILFLGSDALARWLILRQEIGQPVWGHLLLLETNEDFLQFVDHARAEANEPMQNDDVALIVVQFGEPHACYAGQRFVPVPGETVTPPKPRRERIIRRSPVRTLRAATVTAETRLPEPAEVFSRAGAQPDSKLLVYGLFALAFLSILTVFSALAFNRGEINSLKRDLRQAQMKLDTMREQHSKETKVQADGIAKLNKEAVKAKEEMEDLQFKWNQLREFVAKPKSPERRAVLRRMDLLSASSSKRTANPQPNSTNSSPINDPQSISRVPEQLPPSIAKTNVPAPGPKVASDPIKVSQSTNTGAEPTAKRNATNSQSPNLKPATGAVNDPKSISRAPEQLPPSIAKTNVPAPGPKVASDPIKVSQSTNTGAEPTAKRSATNSQSPSNLKPTTGDKDQSGTVKTNAPAPEIKAVPESPKAASNTNPPTASGKK